MCDSPAPISAGLGSMRARSGLGKEAAPPSIDSPEYDHDIQAHLAELEALEQQQLEKSVAVSVVALLPSARPPPPVYPYTNCHPRWTLSCSGRAPYRRPSHLHPRACLHARACRACAQH